MRGSAAGVLAIACAIALVGATSSSAAKAPPAPIHVTTNADETTANGQTSLREAVLQANATKTADTVVFDGDYTITLGDVLDVTSAVTVDASVGSRTVVVDGGSSTGCLRASGKAGMTLVGFTVQHCVTLAVGFSPGTSGRVSDMTIADNSGSGVEIGTSKVTVENSRLNDNTQSGVTISAGSGNKIGGNYIGTLVGGTDHHNGLWGIQVAGTNNEIFGNVIGYNGSGGVYLDDTTKAANNTVRDNLIGVFGSSDLGNSGVGVRVDQPGAVIAGNTISGNSSTGVQLGSYGASVVRNFIGTDPTGATALGNDHYGVDVLPTAGPNTIGTATEGNRVNGNAWDGIQIQAPGQTVKGNLVGVNGSGGAVPNGNNGIVVYANATIGGAKPGEGNKIFVRNGNVAGVQTSSSAVVTILGNTIGLLGEDNGNFGIWLNGNGNVVGPPKAGAGGNTVVGSDLAGIFVQGNGNLVQNNTVHDIGQDGIQVNGGVDGVGTGAGNQLLGNSVYNLQLTEDAIDLFPNDTDANDPGDGDTGNNNHQNFPLLSNAALGTKTWSVSATLNSNTGRKFRIDVYGNSSGHCDDATRETERYLGSATVMIKTGNDVAATVTGKLPLGFTLNGLNATATDLATGDTSEVSGCVTFP